jgi:putative transposase
LYPTRPQAAALDVQLREAARLYNAAIEERRGAWRIERKRISFYDQDRQLKDIRAAGDLAIPSFGIARDVLRRVDRAFDGFFRRLKTGAKAGYPRFRSPARYDSLSVAYGKGMFLRGDRLHLLGIGPIRFTAHRAVPRAVKTIAVKREGDKWFVIVTAKTVTIPMPPTASSVGIDMGLTSFVALSDGTSVEAPRHYRQAERKLRRAQRHLARCQRGSRRRKNAVARVRAAHVAVRNRRADFTHKLSRQIVNQHGRIAVEQLNIKGLARTRLAKSIHDAGWRLFLNQLSYKAASAGRTYVEVNAAGTSQTCLCGASVPKRLHDRWHTCPACGLSAPRDVVSAQVIEARGRRVQTSTAPVGAVVCGGM